MTEKERQNKITDLLFEIAEHKDDITGCEEEIALLEAEVVDNDD